MEFKGEVMLNSCLRQILLFADDTVVIAQTEEGLTENIERLYEAIKYNTMVFSKEYTECKEVVESVQFKQVR